MYLSALIVSDTGVKKGSKTYATIMYVFFFFMSYQMLSVLGDVSPALSEFETVLQGEELCHIVCPIKGKI